MGGLAPIHGVRRWHYVLPSTALLVGFWDVGVMTPGENDSPV